MNKLRLVLILFFGSLTCKTHAVGIEAFDLSLLYKQFPDVPTHIDPYVQWIEYQESNEWLIDRLDRLSLQKKDNEKYCFSYQRSKDDRELCFEGEWSDVSENVQPVFLITRTSPARLGKVEIRLPLVDDIKDNDLLFSPSPDFSKIITMGSNSDSIHWIEIFHRDKENHLQQIMLHAVHMGVDEVARMVTCSNTGKSYAYVKAVKESMYGDEDEYWHHELHVMQDSKEFIFTMHEKPYLEILSCSFNYSENKVGVKTNKYFMIVDLTKKNNPPWYRMKKEQSKSLCTIS